MVGAMQWERGVTWVEKEVRHAVFGGEEAERRSPAVVWMVIKEIHKSSQQEDFRKVIKRVRYIDSRVQRL